MTQRIAHHPREIADCVSAYLQEGDLDGITSMFHPDCQIFFPPDQPPLTGLEGARNAFEGPCCTDPALSVIDAVCFLQDVENATQVQHWSS